MCPTQKSLLWHLGPVFGDPSPTLERNIFDLIKENVQFADGVRIGLGYVFTALEQPLQKEVFATTTERGHVILSQQNGQSPAVWNALLN